MKLDPAYFQRAVMRRNQWPNMTIPGDLPGDVRVETVVPMALRDRPEFLELTEERATLLAALQDRSGEALEDIRARWPKAPRVGDDERDWSFGLAERRVIFSLLQELRREEWWRSGSKGDGHRPTTASSVVLDWSGEMVPHPRTASDTFWHRMRDGRAEYRSVSWGDRISEARVGERLRGGLRGWQWQKWCREGETMIDTTIPAELQHVPELTELLVDREYILSDPGEGVGNLLYHLREEEQARLRIHKANAEMFSGLAGVR